MVRRTDKTEAQLLLEVITGAVDRRRHHPPRGRLHLRGQLRLRRRPGVLVRAEHRRHRRVAAQARLARRDGRRVGACTRRGCGCSSATSTSRWRWARAARRPPIPTLIYPMEMDPYYLAPLGADAASASPRSRPGRCIDAGKVTERQMAEVAARTPPRRAGTTRTRRSPATSTSTRCSPRTTCAAPLRRHDLPPITDGACAVVIARADKARELCEQPGVDHGLRALQRAPLPGHARPHVVTVDHARGQGGRGRRGTRSRWPRSRPRSPTRSRCWSRRSASVPTWR